MSDGLRGKAIQNLRAARTLEASHFDAAASRFYWAAFLGCMHALVARGRKPSEFESGATTWTHTMVANVLATVLSARAHRASYRKLKSLREKADYQPDSLTASEVEGLADVVRDLHTAVRL